MALVVSIPDDVLRKIEKLSITLRGKEAVHWALREFVRIYPIYLKLVQKAYEVEEPVQQTTVQYEPITIPIKVQGVQFVVKVTPSSKRDKIVTILYKDKRKLFVAGEIVQRDAQYEFYPYHNKIEPWYKKTKLVRPEELARAIQKAVLSEKVLETVQEWVDSGVRIRTYEEVLETRNHIEHVEEEEYEKMLSRLQDVLRAQDELMAKYSDEIVAEDPEVQKILEKHGFKSFEEFWSVARVLSRIDERVVLPREYYEIKKGVLKKVQA